METPDQLRSSRRPVGGHDKRPIGKWPGEERSGRRVVRVIAVAVGALLLFAIGLLALRMTHPVIPGS